MVIRIDHIGMAVRDLEKALEFFGPLLGEGNIHREEVPEQKVKTASIPVGEATVELLEPSSSDSPVAGFMEKRGEGIHHLALEVADIEKALELLRSRSVRLIDQTPRDGAGNKRIAFIHPGASHGVLLELCEKKKIL
jgi:lactoylglutathione lyase/methylmalonyl-CoA/ethylmalonyl-CoA epimerase